jgi:hypothetical protein
VKNAAKLFTDQLYFPYDRVGIVTFDQRPTMVLPLSDNLVTVQDTALHLKVYQGVGICPYTTVETPPTSNVDLGGPCRAYQDVAQTVYDGLDCPTYWYAPFDPRNCTSTNIGGGMAMAGNALGGGYPAGTNPIPPVREEALWVTILLTDGSANAGYSNNNIPICPPYTWSRNPYCRDKESGVRHPASDTANYDADDYARDMIDFVAHDQNSLVFSIGLGNLVVDNSFESSPSNEAPGEALMKYAASEGAGIYYFAPTGDQLNDIFLAIANNIATRITK